MNIMKRAHQLTTKRHNAKLLNGIKPAAYKVLFAKALRDAHAEHKEECKTSQVGCRNLYKVIDGASPTQTVVAFLTASSFEKANIRYQSNGGKVGAIKIEQLSWGYPQEELRIFA